VQGKKHAPAAERALPRPQLLANLQYICHLQDRMAAKRTVWLLDESGEVASGLSQDTLQVLGVLGSGGNGTVRSRNKFV
jgi:hypothetical protein